MGQAGYRDASLGSLHAIEGRRAGFQRVRSGREQVNDGDRQRLKSERLPWCRLV